MTQGPARRMQMFPSSEPSAAARPPFPFLPRFFFFNSTIQTRLPLPLCTARQPDCPGVLSPTSPAAGPKANLRAPSLRGSDLALRSRAPRRVTAIRPDQRGRCAALRAARADGARAPLLIGRHLRGRGRPAPGAPGAAPRREVGRCRAPARGGEGSGGKAGAPPRSLQPALPCPLPRCWRCSVAPYARYASRKLCPKKSSSAWLPSRSCAPPAPGPRA